MKPAAPLRLARRTFNTPKPVDRKQTIGMAANKLLRQGASRGDISIVRAALLAGCDVDACGMFKETPLMDAARTNSVEIAKLLLDNGASLQVQCSNNMSPLYYACDNRSTETALLLIERGATANAHEFLGRTSLQIAVKRGLVSVVRALLESGQADPNVLGTSKKTALDYVRSRDQHAQEMKKMLTEFASMENATRSKNVKAVEAILKRCFVESKTVDETVPLFLVGSLVTPLEATRMKLLVPLITSDRPDLFESVLLATWPRSDKSDRLKLLNELRFKEHGDTSTLHVAVYCGHAKFVNYLVTECGMDPRTKDAMGRRPIDLLDERRDLNGLVRAVLLQVTQRLQFQEFNDRLLTSPRTVSGLEELALSISSVRDIRALFSLGISTLGGEKAGLKRVLTCAFTRLINEKLVLNDREALFAKMALRECLRRELVTQAEFEYWNMQVVKVNMESAAWVTALKQSVLKLNSRVTRMEHHVRQLHNEYKQLREVVHGRDAGGVSVGQALSVFTAVLGAIDFDGDSTGEGTDIFGSVFDLSDPQNVVLAVFGSNEGQVALLMEDPSSTELVVRDEMQACLGQAGIDPSELASLLRDAILANQDQATTEGPDEVAHEDIAEEDGEMEAESDVAKDLSPLALEEDKKEDLQVDAATPDGDLASDVLISFPYHFAVKHCMGDIAVFRDVIEFISEADGDVNTSTTVSVPTGKDDEQETVEATPVVYASYLGYVDLVKDLLLIRKDLVPTEKRFVTMQRAQQRAAPPSSS